jgi:hypothetical protein
MDAEENFVPQNARLIVESGDDEGKSFELTNKTMTLGRAEVCDIRLDTCPISTARWFSEKIILRLSI